MSHIPVLAKEVLEGLALEPGMTVLDGTLGLGGHAALMLEATAPKGKLIGVERDSRNWAVAKERLTNYGDRVTTIRDSYGNVSSHNIPPLDAVLLDLGFSSVHVDNADRGFSFMKEGPLDMRYDQGQELTAEVIVNSWSRDDLNRLLREYGEEHFSGEIARAITEARKKQRITTTTQLADLILKLAGGRGSIHPATKTFQALRIAVNDEFGELTRGLDELTKLLKPGGRLAVISFHSLEDRIVKQFIKESTLLESLTKKPIIGSDEEVRLNPRSRSAKLRIAVKK
jgi:16S rRNA (cytosine1402-N4)-methyltransferase